MEGTVRYVTSTCKVCPSRQCAVCVEGQCVGAWHRKAGCLEGVLPPSGPFLLPTPPRGGKSALVMPRLILYYSMVDKDGR